MLCGFGIIFSGMFILMGFIIWDRRTTLVPVVREMEASSQRQKTVEEVLKGYAKKDMKFKEVMQAAGLV